MSSRLRLGAVYRPFSNPDHAYALVRLDESTVWCLQLWSNCSMESVQPGRVWSEPRSTFEWSLRCGEIIRVRGT